MNEPCPICGTQLLAAAFSPNGRDAFQYSCLRCGSFILSGTLLSSLPHIFESNTDARAKLNHALRRAQEANGVAEFSTATIAAVMKRPLPRPQEQADLLVRWLAENLPGPGESVQISPVTHGGIAGSKSEGGFALILDHLFEIGLLTGDRSRTIGNQGHAKATLSFKGWDYYERLSKGGTRYRKGFMAMKFGDAVLDGIVANVFKPAAKRAGFDLLRLDDVPRAGLIDDRLRVEIQASDFLVADLTHDNLGAYWEAGYAEGLGKPVIYTCERSKFEATKTHFDTNHHLTIVWEASAPEVATDSLKATIRATLPHLARQSDEDV